MEEYMNKAVELLSSADIYMVAVAGVLVALLPIIRKTKTKTDDKIADRILAVINKVRSYLPSKKSK